MALRQSGISYKLVGEQVSEETSSLETLLPLPVRKEGEMDSAGGGQMLRNTVCLALSMFNIIQQT